jgi:hypothetical protein
LSLLGDQVFDGLLTHSCDFNDALTEVPHFLSGHAQELTCLLRYEG